MMILEPDIRLQQLRGLLYQTPSRTVWYRICEVMRGRSIDPGMDMALAYAQAR